jgi:hypothetical protein
MNVIQLTLRFFRLTRRGNIDGNLGIWLGLIITSIIGPVFYTCNIYSHVVRHFFWLVLIDLVEVELPMIANFYDAPPPSPFYIKFTLFTISVESN